MKRALELCGRAEGLLRERWVLAVLVAALLVHCGVLASRRMGDFYLYHRAADRLVAGESIYRLDDPHRYLYAPVVTFLFVPLTPLPAVVAAVLWYGFNIWLLFSSFTLAERLVYGEGRAPPGVKLLVALILLRFVDNNLGHGQINLLLLWLVLFAYDRAGRGGHLAAGFALAAAVAMKVFPLVLLLQLLLRRQWRFLGATLAAGAALLVLPVLWWGADYGAVVADWIAVVRDQAGHYSIANKINQSVAAFTHRLFLPHREGAPLWRLAPETVTVLTVAAHAAFLAALAWCSLREARDREAPPQGAEAAELSLYLLYATVASPYSWKYYFIDLLLPLVLLVRRADEERLPGGALTVGGVAALTVLPGLRLFGKAAATAFQLGSFHFLSVVWMFAALLPRRRPTPQVSTPPAVC